MNSKNACVVVPLLNERKVMPLLHGSNSHQESNVLRMCGQKSAIVFCSYNVPPLRFAKSFYRTKQHYLCCFIEKIRRSRAFCSSPYSNLIAQVQLECGIHISRDLQNKKEPKTTSLGLFLALFEMISKIKSSKKLIFLQILTFFECVEHHKL